MPWGQVAKAAGQGVAAVTESMESRSWARLREGRREEALLQAEGAAGVSGQGVKTPEPRLSK